MSKAPSMPMYWDAYIADTTHLTTEEHGAYLLLLGAMWRRNGWVPDDAKDLARILGLTVAKWKRTKERLSGFLIFENGHITQKKLLETWEITQEKIQVNARNGAKGGRAKANNPKDLDQANAKISLKRKATMPEPEPEPIKTEAKASTKKRGTRLPENWTLPKAYGEWALENGWAESVVREQADRFHDYWIGKAGSSAAKLDWLATWRNWMRQSSKQSSSKSNGRPSGHDRLSAGLRAAARFNQERGLDNGTGGNDVVPLFSARPAIGSDRGGND